jgi:hypothetical protein
MSHHNSFIHGTCQQLLFSSRGRIEGALIETNDGVVQISIPREKAGVLAQLTGPGRPLRVLAVHHRSAKAPAGDHPVFKFQSFADANGQALKRAQAKLPHSTIKGVVSAWHFARNGLPNGMILETGEFVHLRPKGMVAAAVAIGSKLIALGELRTTALGTRMLRAHRVNRVDLA